MKKKKGLVFLTVLSMVLGFTACGENAIPDMTEDQMQAVGEYAALIMMRHDANHKSRLVDLSLLEEKKPKPADTEDSEESEEQAEPEGMKPTEDTPIENEAGQSVYSMEETLGLAEGLTLTYSEQEFCDQYPSEEGNDFFAVSASEGKKLLVLKFMLANTGAQDAEADILSSEAVFKVTVNGDYTRKAMTTMLLDDLPTYVGTVSVGESQKLAVVIEVEEERLEDISSIVLNLNCGEKSCTASLL